MKKTAKKKIGRPRGRVKLNRPVLSARVPQDFYDLIAAAAKKSNRTLSEELIYRAKAFGDQVGKVSRDDRVLEAANIILDRISRIEGAIFAKFRADENGVKIERQAW